MKLNQIKVLTKDEIEQIHISTLKLIENVGVKIDDENTRSRQNGNSY